MAYDEMLYNNNLRKYKTAISKTELIYSKYIKNPLMMSFLVTNRCSLKCRHCFNTQYNDIRNLKNEELSFDNYRKISSSMGIIMKGIFSGGEPFLRDDLAEIVSLFQKNNHMMWTSLSTNGQDTQSVVSQIEKILIKAPHQHLSLAFSLDGFCDYHDNIRGQGTFNRCLETWNECAKLKKYSNYDQYICTTINSINQQIMPDFIKWCVDNLKPSMVSLLKTRQHPRDGEYLKNIDLSIYKKCREVIDMETYNGKMGDVNNPQTYMNSWTCHYVEETLQNGSRSFSCYAGRYGGVIQSDGAVGICEVVSPIGNLCDYGYDFSALWNNPYAQKCRQFAGKCQECRSCTHETEGLIPSLLFGDNTILPAFTDENS